MNVLEHLKLAVRELILAPGCSEELIRIAEAKLGEPLPEQLRELYRATNGFSGPTYAKFFWKIDGEKSGLVYMNQFLRTEIFPPMIRNWIFFGDDGLGPMWAIDPDIPDLVVRWDAEWDDFEIAGSNPFDAWARAQKLYDDAKVRSDARRR